MTEHEKNQLDEIKAMLEEVRRISNSAHDRSKDISVALRGRRDGITTGLIGMVERMSDKQIEIESRQETVEERAEWMRKMFTRSIAGAAATIVIHLLIAAGGGQEVDPDTIIPIVERLIEESAE